MAELWDVRNFGEKGGPLRGVPPHKLHAMSWVRQEMERGAGEGGRGPFGGLDGGACNLSDGWPQCVSCRCDALPLATRPGSNSQHRPPSPFA